MRAQMIEIRFVQINNIELFIGMQTTARYRKFDMHDGSQILKFHTQLLEMHMISDY